MTDYLFKYRDLSEALYDSLIADPFYFSLEKTVRGNKVEKMEAMLRYMDYSIVEGELFGQTFFPTEHNHGVSVWLKPIGDKEEIKKKSNKKEFLISQLGQNAWLYYEAVVDFMSLKSYSLITSDSWYLSIVGLRPSHQNKGLGSALICPVLRSADSKGISTYLETFTPRNMKFYEKLGYETVGSFNEPTTGADYWIMARQPK